MKWLKRPSLPKRVLLAVGTWPAAARVFLKRVGKRRVKDPGYEGELKFEHHALNSVQYTKLRVCLHSRYPNVAYERRAVLLDIIWRIIFFE